MTPNEQKKAAKAFVERWKAADGNEQRKSNFHGDEEKVVAHLFHLYAVKTGGNA